MFSEAVLHDVFDFKQVCTILGGHSAFGLESTAVAFKNHGTIIHVDSQLTFMFPKS